MRNSLLFGGLVSEASSVKAKNIVDPLGKSIMQKNRSTASKIKPSKKRVGIKAAL